jgi:hypothetical protein
LTIAPSCQGHAGGLFLFPVPLLLAGRLRELVEEDEEDAVVERAYREIGRSLNGLSGPGRAEGETGTGAASGESPPAP